jgi:hypothetical protein
VRVRALSFDGNGDSVRVAYRGRSIDDLVSAGVASAEMLEPGKKGVRKLDCEGDQYWVSRHRGGSVTVHFTKPIERALGLPGFSIAPLLARFRRPPATSP